MVSISLSGFLMRRVGLGWAGTSDVVLVFAMIVDAGLQAASGGGVMSATEVLSAGKGMVEFCVTWLVLPPGVV